MNDDDFKRRRSELLRSDDWNGALGIKHGAHYYTKAGVSSLYSQVYFLSEATDHMTGHVFVVNEHTPRLLIEIAQTLDRIVSVTTLSAEMGFTSAHASDRDLDISGLVHDDARGGLWLTSDTGKCLFFWTGPQSPARRFDLLWRHGDDISTVHNAEGVALGPDGQSLFIVTDDGKRSKLLIYGIE